MIILGIDPGIATVGFGVIEHLGGKFRVIDYGTVTSPAHTPVPKRLKLLYDDMLYVIDKYRPDEVAVEELFFNTNTKTAITVAQARGVLLLAAENQGLSCHEYTPLQVKQAVVGYGRAEKGQVQQMVRVLLGLDQIPKPDDAADALAIAICQAHSGGVITDV